MTDWKAAGLAAAIILMGTGTDPGITLPDTMRNEVVEIDIRDPKSCEATEKVLKNKYAVDICSHTSEDGTTRWWWVGLYSNSEGAFDTKAEAVANAVTAVDFT